MSTNCPSRGISSRTTPCRPSASNRLRVGIGFGPPAAAVNERPARFLRRIALGLQLFGRGEIAIGGAGGEQLLDGRLIFLQPLRLIVRPIRPADFGAFVPIEPDPVQAVQDRRERFVDVSLRVGVVDPQNELPALPFGEQPIEQRRPHAADVQVAGRAGGEASANGHGELDARCWMLDARCIDVGHPVSSIQHPASSLPTPRGPAP